MKMPGSTDSDPHAAAVPAGDPVKGLRDLSPQQWKSGIAAWLGWLFDGLDMHLYDHRRALRGAALDVASASDPLVKEKSSWIQAAFLIGWALGGGFFGRIGDRLGRSRALSLTILTYALFTGLSFLAQTWWQLLIFRFIAALGIGGEWAGGIIAALGNLAETLAALDRGGAANRRQHRRLVGVSDDVLCWPLILNAMFLVGILPALLVFWIRRSVPETEEWRCESRSRSGHARPAELFRGDIRRTTVLTILICAASLTAWWAFMFWNQQHLRNLPELSAWPVKEREQLISRSFFIVISSSILGNFLAAGLARLFGYRKPFRSCAWVSSLAMMGAYGVPRDHESLLWWTSAVGFFSGVFGLFTMYLPPLFRPCCGRPAPAFATTSDGWPRRFGRCSWTLLARRRFSNRAIVRWFSVPARRAARALHAGACARLNRQGIRQADGHRDRGIERHETHADEFRRCQSPNHVDSRFPLFPGIARAA